MCYMTMTISVKGWMMRVKDTKTKVNVCFYIAQYPVHWTAQSALKYTFCPSWPTCSIRHHLDFSGKNSAMLQLHAKIIHSHFNQRYSLYTASKVNWGLVGRTKIKYSCLFSATKLLLQKQCTCRMRLASALIQIQ